MIINQNNQKKTEKLSELINWTPKQKEADEAVKNYNYILYGGAMGGGKSYFLRWVLVKLLIYYYRKYKLNNVVVGLFCEDYPSLTDRHLSKIETEFPEWLGQRYTSHKSYGNCFILDKQFGNDIIVFRNLDDPPKYQSSEFAAIAVDELTRNDKEVFDNLRTRKRWPELPHNATKFIAGTNPGSIGHAWVKKIWLDREFEPTEREKDKFVFVKALAKDNPYLDEGYWQSLQGLPEPLRKAFLEGDWDLFEGQYFSEWRKDLHACEPFETLANWEKFVSIDYGHTNPSAIYWWAVDYDGRLYAYRELYAQGLTFEDLARKILEITPDSENIGYWVADPSMWNKTGQTELSGAELIYQIAFRLNKTINLVKANNDRLTGWRIMRDYLKIGADGKPKLVFFKNCFNAIKTIPTLLYDSINVEDLDSKGEDHAADSVRYAIMSKPPVSDKPIQEKTKNQRDWDWVERDFEKLRGGWNEQDDPGFYEDEDRQYGSGLE